MKTNRKTFLVALCAMLLGMTSCNNAVKASNETDSATEMDSVRHISKAWGYDTLNYNIEILESNRQAYLAEHPNIADASAEFQVLFDKSCSLDSAKQAARETMAHADSCWQTMMSLCEAGQFDEACDYFMANGEDILIAMPNSTCYYILHSFVAGPMLKQRISEKEYNKQMLQWLEFDKLVADVVMGGNPGAYVPEHYEDLVVELIYCRIDNGVEEDKVLSLIEDFKRAQTIRTNGKSDIYPLGIFQLEYDVRSAYSDLEGMQAVRNAVFEHFRKLSIESGMVIDEEWERLTNEHIDELLGITEPSE